MQLEEQDLKLGRRDEIATEPVLRSWFKLKHCNTFMCCSMALHCFKITCFSKFYKKKFRVGDLVQW